MTCRGREREKDCGMYYRHIMQHAVQAPDALGSRGLDIQTPNQGWGAHGFIEVGQACGSIRRTGVDVRREQFPHGQHI